MRYQNGVGTDGEQAWARGWVLAIKTPPAPIRDPGGMLPSMRQRQINNRDCLRPKYIHMSLHTYLQQTLHLGYHISLLRHWDVEEDCGLGKVHLGLQYGFRVCLNGDHKNSKPHERLSTWETTSCALTDLKQDTWLPVNQQWCQLWWKCTVHIITFCHWPCWNPKP